MAAEYFILIDNIQKGPFPADKLRSHGVTADTLVWRKGLQNWVKARDEPELRPYFPWQPPKKSKPAQPAASEKDAAPKTEETAKPEKVKPLKTSKASSSRLDDLKDWFDNLEPKQRNILIGVVALVLIVPPAVWGIGSVFKKKPGGGYAQVRRQKDPETAKVDPNNKAAGKQVAAKSKKQKLNIKVKGPVGPVVGKNTGKEIPPGKLTEEYYELVRELSFDRATGNATRRPDGIRVRKQSAGSRMDRLKKLAAESGVKSIREFANRAAELFEPKTPAPGVRRPIRVFGGGPRGRGTIRPDILLAQISGKVPDSARYKFELQLQKLWEDILLNMQSQLDSAGKLTPEIAELRWKPDQKPRPGVAKTAAVPQGKLRVTNTSGDTLFHVTMVVNLRTAWGLNITQYYYRDRWEKDKDWPLAFGTRWGTAGENQTVAGDVKIWADNKVMATTAFDFSDRKQSIVPETIVYCESELGRGSYTVPLRVGTGLSSNDNLQTSWKNTGQTIAETAQRIKTEHESLLAATKAGSQFEGIWQFGKFDGNLSIKFVALKEPATGRPIVRNRSNLQTGLVRSPVRATLYEPSAPTEYKTWTGELVFLPEEMSFGLTLTGGDVGVKAETKRLPDTSKNYLLQSDKREYRFRMRDGELWGSTTGGDRFVFVRPGNTSRLTKLRQKPFGREIGRVVQTVTPIPESVLPRLSAVVPINLQWSPGEISRFDTAVDRTGDRKTKKKKTKPAPKPIKQVEFSPSGNTVYGNTGSLTFAWNTRSGKENFRKDTGSPIRISPNNIHLAVPGTKTRLFQAQSGRERLDTKIGKTRIIAFGPKGLKLMGADGEGRVEVFSTNGKSLLTGRHVVAVTALAIGPDGNMALTATADHKINLWDLSTGRFVEGFDSGEDPIDELRISPSGGYVLTVSKPKTQVQRRSFTATSGKRTNGIPSQYELKIWKLDSGEKLYSVRLGYNATAIDISPDWKYALVGEQDGPVSLWDLRKGSEVHRFIGHTRPARGVAFSSDGRFAASGGDDGYLILWGMPFGRLPEGEIPLPPASGKATGKVAGKPPKPVPESVKKRNEALRIVDLAEAAVKSGKRIRASEFLREAESIAGNDPIVKRAIQKVRTLLGTSG